MSTPTATTTALTAYIRTLRAHGVTFDTCRECGDGSYSVKFEYGSARYWARRIREALPGATIEATADGYMALVIVRPAVTLAVVETAASVTAVVGAQATDAA